MTAASPYAPVLDELTRVQGVRGAMIVSLRDGLVVAEHLADDVKGTAVAALTASLAGRLGRALESAGAGSAGFWHLQGEAGAVLALPAGEGLLVVAVAAPAVNVGLVRLELRRAAEVLG